MVDTNGGSPTAPAGWNKLVVNRHLASLTNGTIITAGKNKNRRSTLDKTKTIILKVSGELFGSDTMPVDPQRFADVADQIIGFKVSNNIHLAIVPGGGNIFRGRQAEGFEIGRAMADNMGMLATIINGCGLGEALNQRGVPARNMTAIPMPVVSEPIIRLKALSHLRKDIVVILSGGLGRPYFTTDSALAHLACDLECDLVIKATNVDGIYDSDPRQNPDAALLRHVTHQEVLERHLNVMDQTAFTLCAENNKQILVVNFYNLWRLDLEDPERPIGTWVTN